MAASGVAACALSLAALVQFGAPLPVNPLRAQITDPPPGFKLRPGEHTAVQIRADGGVQDSLRWTLSLRGPGDASGRDLATGTGSVADSAVATLSADDLNAGETYSLDLAATDDQMSSGATVQFLVTDPTYSLIPLNEGNRSEAAEAIYDIDASGQRVLYSGLYSYPQQIWLLDRPSGQRQLLQLPIWATEGARLTSDGSEFCFYGVFTTSGLGCLNLASGISILIDHDGREFYSADASGSRVVYWGTVGSGFQYFLYDTVTATRRQLTNAADAIQFNPGASDCPQQLGERPLISADGSTVVIITHSTLGLVPPDDTVGCHVFTYDVNGDQWRQVAALPSPIVVDIPSLSADGRWLSFPVKGRPPAAPPQALVLDLLTGMLQDPAIDAGSYVTFDSAVTADGKGIVISTEADLDPRVGNADHNLELFYSDFATRNVHQITETIGGVGSTPGGCESYRPALSSDGGVVVLDAFYAFSSDQCHLDGPQRNERDGFIYSFSRAVRRRPGNHGPEFDPIPDQRVLAGETVTLSLAAQDPDGDPISFFAQVKDGEDVPPGSIITDHHDGTATFTWPTRPENAGATVLRVAAYDEGGGEVVQDVTFTVAASDRPPTPSATPAPTSPAPTATAPLAPTPTSVAPAACPADCNGDRQVTIAELLTATNIALGASALSACPAAACDTNDAVTINCLLRAVGAALTGCP